MMVLILGCLYYHGDHKLRFVCVVHL